MREMARSSDLERKILSYLSLKGKERVEELRRALGASKSIYRTLNRLKDLGLIEIEIVSHKERYVALKRKWPGSRKRVLELLEALSFPKPITSGFLKVLEIQALLFWWSFIKSVAAKRAENIYVTTGEKSKKMKPLKLEHLIEPLPSEIRDLINFMLDIHEAILYELDKSEADKIFRVAKKETQKLMDLIKKKT